jgi:hypothetical protein
VTRNTGREQRPPNERVYDSVGTPLLRTRRKNAFAKFILDRENAFAKYFLDFLDTLARCRERRHDPGRGQEADNS